MNRPFSFESIIQGAYADEELRQLNRRAELVAEFFTSAVVIEPCDPNLTIDAEAFGKDVEL